MTVKNANRQALPGETLLKMAGLVFDRDTVERILTPALSDMQQEWLEAEGAGRPGAAAAVRLRGYLDFVRTALAVSVMEGAGRLRRLPPALILAPLALAILGVFWIRAAAGSPGGELGAGEEAAAPLFYKMQAAYLGAGVVFMGLAAVAPVRRLAQTPFRWALVGAALLGATLVFGIEMEGSRRWLSLAGLKVLPGELIKPLFLIVIAGSLAGADGERRPRALTLVAALGALFVIPIVLQPDPALAAVLLLSLAAMGAAAGGRLIGRAGLGLACASLAVIALLFGGGAVGEGAAPLGDRHTDFIGRVIVEQAGLLGVGVVAALMVISLASMRSAAIRGGDRLAQVLFAGAAAMWISQVAIHLGGALGALPRTGVAMPLLSYGGSSVVSFFLTLGLLAGASIPPARLSTLGAPHIGSPR